MHWRTVALLIAINLLICFGSAGSLELSSDSTQYCNTPCYNNNECYSYLCSKCDAQTSGAAGTCVPGGSCGASCVVNTDCNQLSPCPLCTAGTCVAPGAGSDCYAYCEDDNDCQSARCGVCHFPGVCVPGGECNARCASDNDCNRISNCKNCINNECVSKCGQPCEHNDQCEFGCKLCWAGVCVTGPPGDSPSSPPPSSPPPPPPPVTDDCDVGIEVIVRVPRNLMCLN